MGGRSGDVDATVPLFLLRQGYSIDEVDNILNKRAAYIWNKWNKQRYERYRKGYKEDINELNWHSVYTYRIAKYIGSYATILNGFDALVFTAGVGENDQKLNCL